MGSSRCATSTSSRCPSGTGFEFVDKIYGGSVPNQFIPSVEKGIRAQMERGVAAGYPVVDIRATLRDGKAHSVDSSDMAFQLAGGLALRDAAERSTFALLEPMLDVSVLVADDYVGSVMSDLSTRRGRVTGTESVGQRALAGPRRGARARGDPVRDRPALDLARHRRRSAATTCATTRCRRISRQRSPPRRGGDSAHSH